MRPLAIYLNPALDLLTFVREKLDDLFERRQAL
jgi:hypothetical protein